MAGAGDVYGERSDGVCVSCEEVLRCVCTPNEIVVDVEKVAGIAVL